MRQKKYELCRFLSILQKFIENTIIFIFSDKLTEKYSISPSFNLKPQVDEIISLGDNMIVKNFKRSRENMELTQNDIAKLFGINHTTVSGWETGKDTIPIRRLIEYANHFNYSLDYLFGITTTNIDYEPIIIDLNVISNKLLLLRTKNNKTQKEVAEKLNTTQSTYSHYENKVNLIPTSFLFNLTTIYSFFSIDDLFDRKKKNKP